MRVSQGENSKTPSSTKVLIVCKEKRTRNDLVFILKNSISALMENKFQAYLRAREKVPQQSDSTRPGFFSGQLR